MKVLVCGSREATQRMIDYTIALVMSMKEKGYELIVGDAPGIDRAAIVIAEKFDIPTTVYAPENYRPRVPGAILKGHDYLGRDRAMVDAADMVVGVWNGSSKGTKYTVDYAVKQKKPAHLWTAAGGLKKLFPKEGAE